MSNLLYLLNVFDTQLKTFVWNPVIVTMLLLHALHPIILSPLKKVSYSTSQAHRVIVMNKKLKKKIHDCFANEGHKP